MKNKLKLLIHQDGNLIHEELNLYGEPNFKYSLYELPAGIIHCTIINESNQPLAERLIFNHIGTDNFNIDVSPRSRGRE